MVTEVSIPKPRPDDAPEAFSDNQGASNGREISIVDLLVAFAHRKKLIFVITLASAVVSAIIALLLPKQYTAEVTLLTPQQSSSAAAVLSSQLGGIGSMAALAGGGAGFLKNPNDMYVGLFRSRTVEDAVVQRFGLMNQYHARFESTARKQFESHTTVDGSNKDTLIHIRVQDRDPNRAAELANGYVEEFRKNSEHLAITEASQRRLFFEEQLKQAKDTLAKAEESLKETQQKTGLIQLDSQARALIETAAAIRAQITAKQVQIKALETFATGENSQLVQAQEELASLQAQLQKLVGSGEGSDAELIVPKGKVTEAGMEYVRKLRDVKYYETIFEILARQFELAKLDEAKQGAVIQVVDPAVPPDVRSFPNRELIVGAATLVGFFLGLLIALLQAAAAFWESHSDQDHALSRLRGALSMRRS
ncbi:chain length determinant family protein [Acidobacteria bacterium AB60]|nr:chain length determinant family protein [Acidobacteria bacterium AB60]